MEAVLRTRSHDELFLRVIIFTRDEECALIEGPIRIVLFKNKLTLLSLQLGSKRIHLVRTRGGSFKHRALRLDHGNFAWASERTARKTRIIDVLYNASNNELVRTKTLVKNCIVLIDAAPFRLWYESHYALPLTKKKTTGKSVSLLPYTALNFKR